MALEYAFRDLISCSIGDHLGVIDFDAPLLKGWFKGQSNGMKQHHFCNRVLECLLPVPGTKETRNTRRKRCWGTPLEQFKVNLIKRNLRTSRKVLYIIGANHKKSTWEKLPVTSKLGAENKIDQLPRLVGSV